MTIKARLMPKTIKYAAKAGAARLTTVDVVMYRNILKYLVKYKNVSC